MPNKVTSASEAIASIESGMTIGIGGWGSRRKPMALVRELLKTDITDLTVVASDVALEPPVAGDLLVVGTAATSEIQGRLPAGLELSLTGSGAFLETTVLTLPLRVGLDVAVADGAAVLAVRELSLAGLALAADDLPDQVADALADIRIDLPEPVPGVVVTGVEVVPGGLRLSVTGTDVPLRAAG